LKGQLVADLRIALADCHACIAHNVLTLNKNLPLTAALEEYRKESGILLIAWCHDLAWTNEQYKPELHLGYPWDLLRTAWEGTRYVTVSETRRNELAALLGILPEQVRVVVPGIDPARFFHWTPAMVDLVVRLNLLDTDGLLLVPARITRRKNIALALRVLAELRRQSHQDYRLIITGPPGPHNPTNPGYLGELLALRNSLDLGQAVHFLYASYRDDIFIPDDDMMFNLYQAADALFFPSIQEGFGIPILEAGMAGIPIFCADIPPFRETGQHDVVFFDPLNEPPNDIATRILGTLNASPTYRLRVRVRQQYRWDVLVKKHLVPLLEDQ
jgi:glycosyltransferase involved in cell wall biosynthesis